MLLRDFPSCRESIDDIQHITEKRRYILIFKYNDPVHFGLNYVCDNNLNIYDVYLINESVIHGVDFKIPKGITLFNRNQYRGAIQNPFKENGELNREAILRFYNGSYSNRIHRDDDDVFRLSTPTVYEACGGPGGTTIEDEFMRILNSDWIQPYPKFYNIEDQYLFDSKNRGVFVGDFLYDYAQIQDYALGELLDSHTTVATIEMPDFNQLIDIGFADSIGHECYMRVTDDPKIKFDNGVVVELGELKKKMTNLFIEVNKIAMDSIFSQMDVIIDLTTGEFNILPNTLKMKYRELTKKNIGFDYAYVLSRVSSSIEDIFDGENGWRISNDMPDRLSIHISNTGCKMRLSNTSPYSRYSRFHKPVAKSESSAGDTDEMVCIHSSDVGFELT